LRAREACPGRLLLHVAAPSVLQFPSCSPRAARRTPPPPPPWDAAVSSSALLTRPDLRSPHAAVARRPRRCAMAGCPVLSQGDEEEADPFLARRRCGDEGSASGPILWAWSPSAAKNLSLLFPNGTLSSVSSPD
ncbi:unnamed protein product, partial [Urochloa humidicola]